MCDLHCDRFDFEQSEWRTAAKQHECCACDEPIRRGDDYHRTFAIFDREIDVYKHCRRCWAILWALMQHAEPGDTIAYALDCGEVWPNPPPEVASLAFALPGEVERIGL